MLCQIVLGPQFQILHFNGFLPGTGPQKMSTVTLKSATTKTLQFFKSAPGVFLNYFKSYK